MAALIRNIRSKRMEIMISKCGLEKYLHYAVLVGYSTCSPKVQAKIIDFFNGRSRRRDGPLGLFIGKM